MAGIGQLVCALVQADIGFIAQLSLCDYCLAVWDEFARHHSVQEPLKVLALQLLPQLPAGANIAVIDLSIAPTGRKDVEVEERRRMVENLHTNATKTPHHYSQLWLTVGYCRKFPCIDPSTPPLAEWSF